MQALRRKVALLQRHERLAGDDVVAFAHVNLEHAAADPRPDLHRVRLHRPAPLERSMASTDAVSDVGADRDDDNQQNDQPPPQGLFSVFISG